MKAVQATFLPNINSNTDPFEVSVLLDQLPKYRLEACPWPDFEDQNVQTEFSIAHAPDHILLKYRVHEPSSTPVYTNPNEPVYKDSCVEFFLALDQSGQYYNFEFNQLGTGLLAYGTATKRPLVSSELVKQIRYARTFKSSENQDLLYWELTLMIPYTILKFHQISSLSDFNCRANFYKCGDDLPKPHYFAWNNITAESPNFHLPEFFGSLEFVQSH